MQSQFSIIAMIRRGWYLSKPFVDARLVPMAADFGHGRAEGAFWSHLSRRRRNQRWIHQKPFWYLAAKDGHYAPSIRRADLRAISSRPTGFQS